MATPTAIVAYLALFAGVAALFLFVNLLVGKFVRPKLPNEEKLEVYECGEPVVGSSFVQFDLRFYVVALLFIIFDVEVAFFFPWGTVFGKAAQLKAPSTPVMAVEVDESADPTLFAAGAEARLRELGVPSPTLENVAGAEVAGGDPALVAESVRETAHKLTLTSFADIAVFFAVLLVGFAYVWRRGDLDWVRAVSSQQGQVVERPPPKQSEEKPRPAGSILSA